MEFTLQVYNVKSNDQHRDLVMALQDLCVPIALTNTWNEKYSRSIFVSRYDNIKWNSYEGDLTEVSKQFPNLYFDLTCQPKECTPYGTFDYPWKRYFQAGESEWCGSDLVFEKPTRVVWKDNNNTFSMEEISW